ncbi:DUF5676 family membrane protein [Vibrio alginolyticus]|uniref:DUF5676 family membrane protein n=1 Tax=Vibrio alginolyticus TaxID=663 RepID=UPI001BD5EC81|nr:DUF5676 family membrane protein [Vibrio alginolyticus]MBS9869649.1 hypothetical protein [Vibrio alginolyticus]
MPLNAVKFAIASSLSFSIVWIICSLLVLGMPEMMMATSGDMVHMNLSSLGWEMSFIGIFVGLVGWSLSAGVIAWLLATIYNKML